MKDMMILRGLIGTEDMKGLLKAGMLFKKGEDQGSGYGSDDGDLREENNEDDQREGALNSEQRMQQSITQKLYNVIKGGISKISYIITNNIPKIISSYPNSWQLFSLLIEEGLISQ